MSGAGRAGIIMIGVGFPLYLLYTGRLKAYLALA